MLNYLTQSAKWCLFLFVLSTLLITSNLLAQNAHAQVKILDTQVTFPASGAQVAIALSAPTKYSYFTLQKPERLVIDLQKTQGKVSITERSTTKLIRKVRESTAKKAGDKRIVIDLRKDVDASLSFVTRGGKPTLLIAFDDPQPAAPKITTKNQPERDTDIIIALDAGHGGRDPGSVGPAGTYEKRITLAIAKNLQKKINAVSGMRAILTREGDYYISPSARPEIAREKGADLLISIHADAFHTPQPRGGSVWVLNTRRGNSELGKWMERTERHSELLGGAGDALESSEEDKWLMRTLIDMTLNETISDSFTLSQKVIKEMKKVTRMHKKEPQHASLAVLTAPDIPSILVEVGFISNPTEEKNLNWSQHRSKLADSILRALKIYFRANPPDGSLWAMQKHSELLEYKVKSGDSLIRIARRYDVSLENLKKTNNLSSNTIRIGQALKIPVGN